MALLKLDFDCGLSGMDKKKNDFDLFRCALAYLSKVAINMSTTHLVLNELFDA